jgi:hypothetical protein
MYKQPKPILRPDAHSNLYGSFNDAIGKYITNPLMHPFQNCLNCKNWDFPKDECGKFKAKPPTEILIYSCPEYIDGEEVPF